MPEETVGVGFIGCGEIAHLHAAALRDLAADGLPITAVAAADPAPAHREAVAGNFPFERFYDSAEELLADPDVDAVWAAVPTALHRNLYEQVLAAGKHLYAEKPIAPNLSEVRQLAELAAGAPVVTQVGFQSRFDPLLNRARDLVRSEQIGPTMSYLWRDDEGFPTTAIVEARSDWRSHRASAGGGVLIEHSIHAIDVLLWTFGPVVKVTASSRSVLGFDVEDTVVVLLEHSSGVIGTHVGVYGGVSERELSRFEIQGRDAIVEIERNGAVLDAPDNTFLVQGPRSPAAHIDRHQIVGDYLRANGIGPEPFFLQDLSDRAFVEAIRTARPASPGFDDAVAAHAVIEAAYRSAAQQRPVELAELDA
jgi:predicted dehydrogenase